jgi:hypothetical protein
MGEPLTFVWCDGWSRRLFEAGSATELLLFGLDALTEWSEPGQVGQRRPDKLYLRVRDEGPPDNEDLLSPPDADLIQGYGLSGADTSIERVGEYLEEHGAGLWERAVCFSRRQYPIGSADPDKRYGPVPF